MIVECLIALVGQLASFAVKFELPLFVDAVNGFQQVSVLAYEYSKVESVDCGFKTQKENYTTVLIVYQLKKMYGNWN